MIAALVLPLALPLPAGARETIGVYQDWAAFRDTAPQRCFAIARPIRRTREGEAFVSIANWPGARVRHQIYVRLGRVRAANARVTLVVGERRFDLIAGAQDAWAPDSRTDAAVVAAIRDGRSLSIESTSARGAPFVEAYTLNGAASAIDAAALACMTR
ncbi:hypothetical protein ACX40Y_02150 [Sphingomonas sp. RS6]